LYQSGSWLLRLNVAHGAGKIGMLPPQGKSGFRMIKPVHRPFLPAAFGVARSAGSSIGSIGKLLPVRIRMTVGAGLKLRDAKAPLTGLLIGLTGYHMTFLTLHLLVPSFERIAGC
jgi:hypothetical protein